MSKPDGRSKRSAGPPPGDLQARSVTAAISRSGLTGSPTRESRRFASRSARKSVRSLYMHLLGDLIRDLLRQCQGATPFGAGDERLALRAHRVDEVGELARERLFADDLQLAPFDRRHQPTPLHEPPQIHLLRGVVDR